MRPIFSRSVPGAVDVGFDVNAFRSRAARMASLTLRGWVGGRRWLFGGADGSRDDARSLGNGDCPPLRVVAFWGVTQNM